MCPQPGRERGLFDFTGGNGKYDLGRFQLCRLKAKAVECQKQTDGKEGCTLVAIGEWMILRQPAAISGGQIREVRLAVSDQIQRPGQCRIKQPFIAQTGQTAMFGQAFSMQQQQDTLVDPACNAAHFAST